MLTAQPMQNNQECRTKIFYRTKIMLAPIEKMFINDKKWNVINCIYIVTAWGQPKQKQRRIILTARTHNNNVHIQIKRISRMFRKILFPQGSVTPEQRTLMHFTMQSPKSHNRKRQLWQQIHAHSRFKRNPKKIQNVQKSTFPVGFRDT